MALGPTHPPIQWLAGALSLGVKLPGREADHSPPSSGEVKEWVKLHLHSSNTPSWHGARLKKHRDSFTFYLLLVILLKGLVHHHRHHHHHHQVNIISLCTSNIWCMECNIPQHHVTRSSHNNNRNYFRLHNGHYLLISWRYFNTGRSRKSLDACDLHIITNSVAVHIWIFIFHSMTM
jgi:hypothetical protein